MARFELRRVVRSSRFGAPVARVSVLLAVIVQLAQPQAACAVSDAFVRNEIVPDLVPSAPNAPLTVSYSSGVNVSLGNELSPLQVKDKPALRWRATPDALYTVMLADPDAPSRSNPEMRSWKHWLVGNVPGTNVDDGDVLADYVGAGPPQGTGLHRYVFLVYQQPSKVMFNETILSSRNPNRGKWSLTEFVEKYGLGSPVAGNFFQAQYDDYVPELYATFTET